MSAGYRIAAPERTTTPLTSEDLVALDREEAAWERRTRLRRRIGRGVLWGTGLLALSCTVLSLVYPVLAMTLVPVILVGVRAGNQRQLALRDAPRLRIAAPDLVGIEEAPASERSALRR